MKAFIYKDDLYIRCIPGKNLFKSTMVHEVVNRGDVFALRVKDQLLTIIKGTEDVEHVEVNVLRAPMTEDYSKHITHLIPSGKSPLFDFVFPKTNTLTPFNLCKARMED